MEDSSPSRLMIVSTFELPFQAAEPPSASVRPPSAFTSALGGGNVDQIADFLSGTDKIGLDDAVFAGIGTAGAFNASAFVTGSAAQDADDRIVYDQATGQLFYDADGNGSGAAVLFATLGGTPILTASDFQVI